MISGISTVKCYIAAVLYMNNMEIAISLKIYIFVKWFCNNFILYLF